MGKESKAKSAQSGAWRKLYGLADRIQELAPWRWMHEDHIFGVRFTEKGAVGFVSVMGALGEHRAVTVYLGPEGLRGFLRVEMLEPMEEPTAILHVPQLPARVLPLVSGAPRGEDAQLRAGTDAGRCRAGQGRHLATGNRPG